MRTIVCSIALHGIESFSCRSSVLELQPGTAPQQKGDLKIKRLICTGLHNSTGPPGLFQAVCWHALGSGFTTAAEASPEKQAVHVWHKVLRLVSAGHEEGEWP